jgi:hypothetical protein
MGNVDFPIISKDGKTLLFLQTRIMGHLWLANLDGSMQREEIFSTDRRFDYPDISPDGKFIAMGMRMSSSVMSSYGTGTSHLFIMNRDGTNLRQITSGEIACYKPRWSPDGKLISYYARGRYEPIDSFKVYVINAHKLDVPRFVHYGVNQTWADSVTLEMWFQGDGRLRIWRGYLDGRAAIPFSTDSINARTICNGQYVQFEDVHKSALVADFRERVCLSSEWDGRGPENSYKLPGDPHYLNYDALYGRDKFDIYRISFHDWKMEKLNVNVQSIDTLNFFIRTTEDGKEMVYKTTESVNKLGIIENLFK